MSRSTKKPLGYHDLKKRKKRRMETPSLITLTPERNFVNLQVHVQINGSNFQRLL